MSDTPRIQATPAARAALEAVRAREGGQVMFVQSGGCCAGSVPMCFGLGEFLTGDGDTLLGDVDGAPFYIEESLDEALGRPSFVLDVAPGGPEGFSLGTVDGGHFVSRSTSCLADDAMR
ncbi:MAG TPA: DUF779 domain-containing protein [Actinomycetaceae bacterium]|nr:DUF779 domain-containing protein [Actinomycetaceae bacterium]